MIDNNYCLILSPPKTIHTKNVIRDFLYGCWCSGKKIGGATMPPLQLLYTATILRDAGIPVQFIDASVTPEEYHALEREKFQRISSVVMLVATHTFIEDVGVLERIKKQNPHIKTIVYGAHPTARPYDCLKSTAIDFVILNEPEFILRDLMMCLYEGKSYTGLKGIGFKGSNNEVVVCESAPYQSIDALPIPDRSLLKRTVEYFNPLVHRVPYTTMLTSRGCAGKCIFCSVPSFYGGSVRMRSLELVQKEIDDICAAGYKEIIFRDETFTAFRERNKALCSWLMKEKKDLTWIANARVDMIDEEMIRIMKQAGCHTLKFGIESGSDEILKRIKKGTTVVQTRKVFRMLHEAGMKSHVHLLIGNPGETEETIRKTIALAKEINPTTVSFSIVTPYPNTELYHMLPPQVFGDGTSATMEKLHTTAFHNELIGSLVAGKDLERWMKTCHRQFYLRPGYLWGWLKHITNVKHGLRLVRAGIDMMSYVVVGKE